MASQNGELGGYGKFAIGDYASFTGIGKTADQTKRRTARPSFWRHTNGPIEILAKPYAVVLLRGVGRMAQPSERRMVEDLAGRLGIEKVVWLD